MNYLLSSYLDGFQTYITWFLQHLERVSHVTIDTCRFSEGNIETFDMIIRQLIPDPASFTHLTIIVGAYTMSCEIAHSYRGNQGRVAAYVK